MPDIKSKGFRRVDQKIELGRVLIILYPIDLVVLSVQTLTTYFIFVIVLDIDKTDHRLYLH